jgi:hypothetical protein
MLNGRRWVLVLTVMTISQNLQAEVKGHYHFVDRRKRRGNDWYYN